MSEIKLLLVGIGGYGNIYAGDLLENPIWRDLPATKIVGIVDPYPENGKYYPAFQKMNIPVYKTMTEFYAEDTADLCVISTPIEFHTRQILEALSHGSHVLCEKPLCGDAADIEKLIAARDRAGKNVYIGYQWSHNEAIGLLKADVMAGRFGAPVDFRTLILWPRDKRYFNRTTGWAGKIRSKDGTLIYDSVANNAAAHYLHNMLYILGDRVNTTATPASVEATLLRANPIENFDTAAITCRMGNGATLRFIASHTIDREENPIFEYRFEKGVVRFADRIPQIPGVSSEGFEPGSIVATMNDGKVIRYGNPFAGECRKLHLAVRAAAGESVTELCGIETAAVHTRLINRMQEDTAILPVDPARLRLREELTYVEGLYEALIAEYGSEGAGNLSDFTEVRK